MATSEIPLTARVVNSANISRTKPVPISFACNRELKFSYTPSADGVDSNLLCLLHGRGDNEKAFAKLGQSLALPQTATLAIQGPLVVPLLDDHEREWWPETDYMGMDVPNPNPNQAIALLTGILNELTATGESSWRLSEIHLFGFGQGGTLSLETGQELARRSIGSASSSVLGSIVSVQGPLLSLPTTGSMQSYTRMVYITRPIDTNERSASVLAALRRAYCNVQTVAFQGVSRQELHMPCMPRNKSEWEPIMKFWSEVLQRRSAWELDEDVLEVTGGQQASVSISERRAAAPSSSKSSTHKTLPVRHKISQDNAKHQTDSGLKRGFLSQGLG